MNNLVNAINVLSHVEDNLCNRLVSEFEDANPILGLYRHVLKTYTNALIYIENGNEISAVEELKKIMSFKYNGLDMYTKNKTLKSSLKEKDFTEISRKASLYVTGLSEESYTELLKIFESCKNIFDSNKSVISHYHFLNDAFYFLSSVGNFHCALKEARKEEFFSLSEVSQELKQVFRSLGSTISDVNGLVAGYTKYGIKC